MSKTLTRKHCICGNTTFYSEYNPDWHGMYVSQLTCTNCGVNIIQDELHPVRGKYIEKEDIEKELFK